MGCALLAPAIPTPAAAGAFVPRSALAPSQQTVTLVDGYRYHTYHHRHHSYYDRRPLSYGYAVPRPYYVVPVYRYAPVVYLPPPVYEYSAPSGYAYCAPPVYHYEERCCGGW
jgi:hypothetical protein